MNRLTKNKYENKHLHQFVNQVAKLATRHDINVRFIQKRFVSTEGLLISGFFRSEPGELVVAIRKPEKEWSLVLAHEFCHMQQWINGTRAWTQTISRHGIDTSSIIDIWLNGLCELSEKQKKDVFHKTINLEFECEKMTVELFKKHPAFADVNIAEYIQKANAYLYFYYYVARHRKWPTGKVPQEIWKKMPTTFQKGYLTYPYTRLYESAYGARR